MNQYTINEIFYSLQGEGMRAGTANVFVRFTGCNLRCTVEPGPKSPGGFDCDTEFVSGRRMTLDEIHTAAVESMGGVHTECARMILTGGEPGLQVDREFINEMHERGWRLAIETNGSIKLPDGIDWITVSPKVAEHVIRQTTADEVKFVRTFGQAIPKTCVEAEYRLISPAFMSDVIDRKALHWCIQLVKKNPEWRPSPQQHKA